MILAVACSPVKVVTETTEKVDFSGYTTYSFLGWQKVDDEVLSNSDLQLMKDSFIKEIERRGLKAGGADADLRITCYLVTSNESAFSGYNDYVGRRSSGYNHYSTGWSYGYAGTTSKQQAQLVGTLIMNVYEGNSKNQIWQAVATKKVKNNPQKDRSKSIPASVASVMRKFPIRPK
jgi:hypothetical protein